MDCYYKLCLLLSPLSELSRELLADDGDARLHPMRHAVLLLIIEVYLSREAFLSITELKRDTSGRGPNCALRLNERFLHLR